VGGKKIAPPIDPKTGKPFADEFDKNPFKNTGW
jgi:hypothetical protein